MDLPAWMAAQASDDEDTVFSAFADELPLPVADDVQGFTTTWAGNPFCTSNKLQERLTQRVTSSIIGKKYILWLRSGDTHKLFPTRMGPSL